jgi:YhcH/YjgK/YiaL family protein
MDVLPRWSNYSWSDNFRKAFAFLQNLKSDAPEGRTEVDGDNVFCMVQCYETRAREGQRFEAHRKYADIQMLLAGEESILWAPADDLKVSVPYEGDAVLFDLIPSPTNLIMTPGVFCVLFPPDAHAPCLQIGKPSNVRKAVVKVRVA